MWKSFVSTSLFIAYSVLFISGTSAYAAPINPPQQKEVIPSKKIIDDAKANISQRLIVTLQADDINANVRARREAEGFQIDNESHREEKRLAYAATKEKVFPRGRLGNAIVKHKYEFAPTVVVEVPNEEALRQILSHPDVTGVFENAQITPYLTESLPQINQLAAINTGKRGAGTRVAIIDSGVDYTNKFFSTDGRGCTPAGSGQQNAVGSSTCKVSTALNFTLGPWTKTGEMGPSQSAHGTNVAAIAASVAPDTKIDSLQVYYVDSSGKVVGYLEDILRAIDWVVNNANKGSNRIAAMNISLGTRAPYSSSECSNTPYSVLFFNARQAGIVPVSASGNEGSKTSLPEPACVTGGVSVGGVFDVNVTGAIPCNGRTSFAKDSVACISNSSPALSFLAPGISITAAGIGWMGTSQAAPHVSGAIALLRGNNAFPLESTQYTINRLKNTGTLIRDLDNGVVTPRINVYAALLYAPEPPRLQPVHAIINQLLLIENGLDAQ